MSRPPSPHYLYVRLCLVAALAIAVGSAMAQPTPVEAKPKASPTWSQRSESFGPLEWVTRPSRDATMSFTIASEVREVPVKPGQRVRKGDLLVRARDGDALTAVEVQRVRASNTGEVDSAKATLELAEVRYKRIQEADAEKATNQQEMDERRVSVDAARANLVNAQKRSEEEAARLKQLEEQAARYRLEAPFDGVVETIMVDSGALIEPPSPVLRIVNIDTLWIDLPTPTDITLAKGLKMGDAAWVMLDVPQAEIVKASVLYVSPVADAAAGTRRVRIEVPNPKGYPPGTRARVRFEAPTTAQGHPTRPPYGFGAPALPSSVEGAPIAESPR